MSCPRDRLADLVDGRLGPAAHELALAHVAGCESCRAELVALRSLRSLLAATPGPTADRDLTDRLAAFVTTGPIPVVRLAETEPETRRGPAWATRRRVTGAAAVAGGATVAVVAFAWGASLTGAVTPGATPVVPAVDRYTVEHAATTDGFPLTAPGSTLSQVAYGAPDPTAAIAPAGPRQLRP